MATHKGSGQIGEVAFTIQVFREGQAFVAYAPELDVSTTAGTLGEAKTRLLEAVEAFLEEAQRMGTLGDVLVESGYQQTPEGWRAPDIIIQERAKVAIPR
jgi:predicted RNase H-like HicB family nuclease